MTEISTLTQDLKATHTKVVDLGSSDTFVTLWAERSGEEVELVQTITFNSFLAGRSIVALLEAPVTVGLEEAHDEAENMEVLAVRTLEEMWTKVDYIGFGRKVDEAMKMAA